MEKRYIGDGVYVDDNGYGLVLTTENGIEITNRIILEPEVYGALVKYVLAGALVKYVRALKEAPAPPPTHESARPCGCDPGASWICEAHR